MADSWIPVIRRLMRPEPDRIKVLRLSSNYFDATRQRMSGARREAPCKVSVGSGLISCMKEFGTRERKRAGWWGRNSLIPEALRSATA